MKNFPAWDQTILNHDRPEPHGKAKGTNDSQALWGCRMLRTAPRQCGAEGSV